ncbi:MAG: autotransporter outer membrane beta-barrel domain-containing protein [Cetobacterium sp.]|uniref:autotransporter outer membrane beta-barrel domain-containing protein n=1 Tax=Cetobacterium sp. TaxID=2071632 RepID=UPI003F2DD936
MKVNKKLLLATLILLIGTNSYSRIYVDNKTTTLTGNGNIDKQWSSGKDNIPYEATGVTIRNNGILTLDENFDYTLDYTDKNNEGKNKIFDIEKNGTLINNGNISANGNNNLIVDIRGGEFTNNGNINITGEMTGININNSSKAINNGSISITGKGTISKIANGIFENNGTLNILGNDANGLIVSGSNSTAINNQSGVINVAGQKANGIKVENGGTGTNKGTINIDKNGKISNKWASGILATGNNSKGTNEGDIFVQGYSGSTSHGLQAQSKGTVINEKTGNIYTNGRFASGITVTTGASGINKGNIYNQNGAQAIRVEGGTSIGINEGNIVSTTSDSDSAAIYLDGGIFINSGTIDATHNAIFSDSKKNNSSTVVMNSGSSIKGKILGNDNVNLLYMNGSNNYENLDIEKYEVLVSRGGDNSINNSKVELVFNNKISETFDKTNNTLESNGTISKEKGNLTLSNSILTIDMKNSNGEKPIIDANKVILDGNMNFVFNSSEPKDSYSLKEALGVDNLEFASNFKPDSTILWDYNTSNGDLTATKKTYRDVVNTTKLNSFLDILESDRSTKFSTTSIFSLIKELEVLKPGQEWSFQNGMTQLSGGIYAYLPDLAILNSRTLVSTINNRIYQKDFTRGSSVNSSSQDIVYIDNSHRLGGLMNVKYEEKSILGITEKQIDSNSILGFVYGGGNGKVNFENNINGKGTMDLIYFGGYYNHNFTKNFSLNTNLRVNYQHNSIDRYISIGDKNYSFNSTTPTYAFGLGSRGRYSINKSNYSFGIFAGLDWTKVVQGSINEETSTGDNLSVSNVGNPTATSGSADDRVFDSVIPSLGLDFNNTGYIFNKKYSFGGNVAYETELGNIKNGKKIKIRELSSAHYVKSTDRENILSYSIFGKLYLTEDLSLSTTYTASKSKEYDADKLTVGSEYKFNSFGGNLFNGFNNMLEKAQNSKHDRWRGTVTFSLESEDDTDRVYMIAGKRSSGDYKTSTSYIPKIMISLNDTKTKWSYYFEGFYRDNEMLQGLKGNEAEQHATRIHLEARWNDSFSRGRYGINLGYRNETAEKPSNFDKKNFREVKVGVHQFRLTPNFVYKIGKGFNLTGSYANILKYNYLGDREGQTDFTFENQTGILYDGFMPNFLVRLNYFNETTWLDHNNTSEKYKNTQIRPSLTYYFGNGASLLLEGRISIDGGGFYKQTRTHLIKSESQESRYGFTYTQPIAPGLSGFVGMNFLIYKNVNKEKNTSAKTHSFRPKVGFNYSF